MTADQRAGGYSVGPTLPADQAPWPSSWEHALDEQGRRRVEQCPHAWESCLLLADGHRRVRMEEVVRCAYCHAPRCSGVTDPDPCQLHRHHRTDHRALSGYTWPLGGSREDYPPGYPYMTDARG